MKSITFDQRRFGAELKAKLLPDIRSVQGSFEIERAQHALKLVAIAHHHDIRPSLQRPVGVWSAAQRELAAPAMCLPDHL
ncbi:hypothetical protein [Rhizobium sophoriradicis]|uniref:hypothetical protein n=1 Tax=Rhizobium sophoriradicis TaxID=1535245 RepID=UPI000F78E622|nr:hypothetical protein [Rhizobium sophoriradicis]